MRSTLARKSIYSRQDAVHSHKRDIGIIGIVIGKRELGLEASAAAKAFPYAVMLLSNVAAIHAMHRDVESRVCGDARHRNTRSAAFVMIAPSQAVQDACYARRRVVA